MKSPEKRVLKKRSYQRQRIDGLAVRLMLGWCLQHNQRRKVSYQEYILPEFLDTTNFFLIDHFIFTKKEGND